jgi:hypothetical protein
MKPKRVSQTQERDYLQTLRREIKDYMRTGDRTILSRVILKMFANHTTPPYMHQEKSKTVMMLLMHDPESTTSLTIE